MKKITTFATTCDTFVFEGLTQRPVVFGTHVLNSFANSCRIERFNLKDEKNACTKMLGHDVRPTTIGIMYSGNAKMLDRRMY